jgi:hypothetical protein
MYLCLCNLWKIKNCDNIDINIVLEDIIEIIIDVCRDLGVFLFVNIFDKNLLYVNIIIYLFQM